ncbi:MAG: hypothetical protein E7074_01870 [Bacteroidales bacterium]|nr:hypothetical protein [Bacteroidales bacterium]
MTKTSTYKYLRFINYSRFFRWDVKAYAFQHKEFDNAVLLQDILTPYDVPLSKEEMIENGWSIISKINFSGKLFLREPEETKSFKGSVHKVDGDTLIYSKINVRHGCVYYHPNGATPFGVSSEYPAYKINQERVNGDFLVLLLQSQYFKDALSARTSGISKARVKPSIFLTVEIPLPSLEEQNAIVTPYNNSLALADGYEQQAYEKEDSIQQYISQQLGVMLESHVNGYKDGQTKYKYLRFYHIKDILRWDCYNQQMSNNSEYYPTISLSHLIIEKPKYGAGYKAARKPNEVRYVRITDINEDGTLNDDFVSAVQFDEQYVLKQDDFLIARSGNTVGKTFLYDDTYGKAIYAGYLIKFVLDKSKINPKYLLAYTKSPIYKQWIQGNMRVSAQPNINSQQYLESPIIVPPMMVQNEIVAHVFELKEQIKSLRALAATTRTAAIQQFEQTIFE